MFKRFSTVLFSTALLLPFIPALVQAEVRFTTIESTTWQQGFGAPKYSLHASGRDTPQGAWMAADPAFDFKAQGVSPSFITTGTVALGIPQYGAAFGVAQRDYNLGGNLIRKMYVTRIAYNTRLTFTAPGYGEARASVKDPYTFEIGPVGTDLSFVQSLGAGTTLQARATLSSEPGITLYSRFGIGSQFLADTPDTLWGSGVDSAPSSAPAGATDLFGINIRQNANGTGVDATVVGTAVSLSGFSVVSTATAAQIESAIEAAPWVLLGGVWTLQSDLTLFEATFTNLSAANAGVNFAVGAYSSTITAVPEVPTASLILAGLVPLLLRSRMRRSSQTAICDPDPSSQQDSRKH